MLMKKTVYMGDHKSNACKGGGLMYYIYRGEVLLKKNNRINKVFLSKDGVIGKDTMLFFEELIKNDMFSVYFCLKHNEGFICHKEHPSNNNIMLIFLLWRNPIKVDKTTGVLKEPSILKKIHEALIDKRMEVRPSMPFDETILTIRTDDLMRYWTDCEAMPELLASNCDWRYSFSNFLKLIPTSDQMMYKVIVCKNEICDKDGVLFSNIHDTISFVHGILVHRKDIDKIIIKTKK